MKRFSPAAALWLSAAARTCTTSNGAANNKPSTPEEKTSKKPESSTATAAKAAEEAPKNTKQSSEEATEKKASGDKRDSNRHSIDEEAMSNEELLQALRAGNFSLLQKEAVRKISRNWHEDYTIPLACAVFLFVFYYWHSSTARRVERLCAQAEAKIHDDVQMIEERVRNNKKKWEKDMATRTQAIEAVQRQNSELAQKIDQMTTALKNCNTNF